MTSKEIDKLCTDWLRQNCGDDTASRYRVYSMVVPLLSPPDVAEGLEGLKDELCQCFGPEESFGTTDYREARRRLGLTEDEARVPEVFIRAFEEG